MAWKPRIDHLAMTSLPMPTPGGHYPQRSKEPDLRRFGLTLALLFGVFAHPAHLAAQGSAGLARQHLEAGTLLAGEAALQRLADADPRDADARLGQGFVQFVRAVERLGQGFHRYGLQPPRQSFIPILRLPVPPNPNPEKLDYGKLRMIYVAFLADLAKAERTLARVPAAGEPKIILDLGKVRLDLDGDGRADQAESLGVIMASISGQRAAPMSAEIAFDRADGTWLRGYTQILSALLEFVLAYDWSETYTAAGHHFFAGARDPANPLHREAMPNPMLGSEGGTIADSIAMIHLIRWPLAEPERMKRSLEHLKRVPVLSRQNWREILAETDDDREWLPNPNQKSRGLVGMPVTQELVGNRMKVMDEFEDVLEGRKLIAHWRFQKGIDLKAFYESPRPFDLVLWITGHSATPYLKDGPMVSGETTRQWQLMFGGNFLGYAFWFN